MKAIELPSYNKPMMKHITIISLNNTRHPRAGGEFVYNVLEDELIQRGYIVKDYSLPLELGKIKNIKLRKLLTPVYYFYFILISLMKRYLSKDIVITSSSPAFPLFGDIVYHQPKASIGIEKGTQTLYEKIAMIIHEKEFLSPLWLLAKKSHVIHISNSQFTQQLVKKLYKIDSTVVYPPVETEKYLGLDTSKDRPFSILIVRPRGITGINLLNEIIELLPKEVTITVFGKIDQFGKNEIQLLKNEGYKINYLGYIDEKTKIDLFGEYSYYLHLSKNETFGITVIESMASGCIPVAPKSGAIPEYLPKQLQYTSPQEAVKILLDKEIIKTTREHNREISKNFNRTQFANKIISLIEQGFPT